MSIDLSGPLGFGGAPLGNMFRRIDEEEATATLTAAWDAGIRLYDTAPTYGAGLSEIRLGKMLRQCPRDAFVLCTKVGRLIGDVPAERRGRLFHDGLPYQEVYDFTAGGTLRSIEESLARMGLDRVDVVFIHDVAADHFGEQWTEVFDQAMNGAAKALSRLRDEGVIRGWGMGVNLVEPCLRALERADPNVFLLAGRYSLLDHTAPLHELFPLCVERDVRVIVGGPFNSGLLAGGSTFEYAEATDEMKLRAKRLEAICERYGVNLKAAALQFCVAHPAVAAVIPGASRPQHVPQNVALMQAKIPAELWTALRHEGLIEPNAPVPQVPAGPSQAYAHSVSTGG